jgi:peptide/nickel transport system substrate-binding protein
MRTSRLPLTALVLGLGLTACSGSPPDSGSRGPCPDDATCGQGGSIGQGPAVVAGATPGGTVTVLTQRGLDRTIDPSVASDRATVSILSGLVTRSLTQYRYDPAAKEMILTPDLSTALGFHNHDFTKWEFAVRPGVRFEDGSHVTAYDVARGVRRCLDAQAFPTSPCLDAPIRTVRVHGDLVMIHLSAPYPDLPYLAAMPAFGPIPPGVTPGYAAYARRPVATGPYRIKRYVRGRRLRLVRNLQWDPATDPARTQYPDGYDIRGGMSDTRIGRLLREDHGTAQTTLTFDTLRSRELSGGPRQERMVLGGSPCTTYLVPDNRTITDPEVRRALIWAYPYRAVLRAEGLAPGLTAVPATNLQPPGIPGRTSITVRGHHGFATQPRVARRLLERAHARGTRLRFHSPGDPAGVRIRDALVHSLRAAGFDPQPVGPGLPVDLRTSTRCGAWPSGEQWLPAVYASQRVPGFSSPSVARKMRRIEAQPLNKQAQEWNDLDHEVLRRWQPIVPIWYAGVEMAHGSRVRGMVDDSVHGMPVWQRLWVDTGS